jgi:hypothetical protein
MPIIRWLIGENNNLGEPLKGVEKEYVLFLDHSVAKEILVS